MKKKFITASEYCNSVFDGTHNSPKSKSIGYPLITSKHLGEEKLDFKSANLISEEDYVEINRRSKIQKWDILFSMIGTVGRTYMERSPNINYAIKNIGVFSCKDEKRAKCLYWYLQTETAKRYIKEQLNGAVQSFLSLKQLREFPVPEDLELYYDNLQIIEEITQKIYCNNEINRNLLELLISNYRENFKDGSSIGRLSDISSYSEKRIETSLLSLNTYYSTENMLPDKAGATIASKLPSTSQSIYCKQGDVLISNIRPYFKKIVLCQNDSGCSSDVLCFEPNTSKLSAFLFCTLYQDEFFDYVMSGAKGTKMPRGDKIHIMNYTIKVPKNNELNAFNIIANPILKKVSENKKENINLINIRDSLLSKLMSGEIDLSALNVQ